MAQAQVIEGTTEEIAQLMQGGAFAGRRARMIIEADEEDFTADLPDPPNTIRDAAHLEQLLLEGMASPVRKMTDTDWQALKRRTQEKSEGESL